MEDLPRNLQEFEARFSTEKAYLLQIRWPDGFCCPRCDGWTSGPKSDILRECGRCGNQGSVRAGTIFQETRKPLVLWFRKQFGESASQKNGASATGLQRVLGVRSYKTAWTWLHKLRRAMVRPGRDRLTGKVEVHETHVGAPQTSR
jgi:hypothetical protein